MKRIMTLILLTGLCTPLAWAARAPLTEPQLSRELQLLEEGFQPDRIFRLRIAALVASKDEYPIDVQGRIVRLQCWAMPAEWDSEYRAVVVFADQELAIARARKDRITETGLLTCRGFHQQLLGNMDQAKADYQQALVLVASILMIIYAVKTAMHQFSSTAALIFMLGAGLLSMFVRHQLKAASPMIDFSLFKHPVISASIVMAVVAMIALVGFELLLSQELQFVYNYTPLQAGLFILPFMIAISIGGPFAGFLMNRYSLRPVAAAGMLMCALSFWGLAVTDFNAQHFQAWAWMIVMGISVEIALLSSTAAIMSAIPPHKATAAGAIEGMAYELGAGLGIAIFGLLLSFFYAQSIILPAGLMQEAALAANASIAEAMQAAKHLEQPLKQSLIQAAAEAFTLSHGRVLAIAGGMFFILSIFIWWKLPSKQPLAAVDAGGKD